MRIIVRLCFVGCRLKFWRQTRNKQKAESYKTQKTKKQFFIRRDNDRKRRRRVRKWPLYADFHSLLMTVGDGELVQVCRFRGIGRNKMVIYFFAQVEIGSGKNCFFEFENKSFNYNGFSAG